MNLSGSDIRKIIERDGEVFLAPTAVTSPGAHSSRERDFRLDNTKICHPITTRLADEFQYIFNIAIMSRRWQTCMASSKKDCDQVDIEEDEPFLNPFAPWDERYKLVLGGELAHLGKVRVVLAFSVRRLIGYRCMINASGQLTIDGSIPFSEVARAWYQTNAYKWERLLVDSGGIQLVRSIKQPSEIATVVTVKRIARALLDEIGAEDNVPYYDEFVRDVGEVESMTGDFAYQSDLRNRLVTFIAENYVPRETGRIICPTCHRVHLHQVFWSAGQLGGENHQTESRCTSWST